MNPWAAVRDVLKQHPSLERLHAEPDDPSAHRCSVPITFAFGHVCRHRASNTLADYIDLRIRAAGQALRDQVTQAGHEYELGHLHFDQAQLKQAPRKQDAYWQCFLVWRR